MTFKLKNISNSSVSYTLGDYSMTESLSADKKYVAEQAYMLSNNIKFEVSGGTLSGKDKVTVAANQTATITATVTLSDKDKAYINSSFPNGMYVEGFITLKNSDKDGVDLNVPYLAFYGDWSDAPIFDKDYYLVETQAHNPAIDDDDKIKADYYATTPLGIYYYDYIIPMGSYLYQMDETAYTPIPATAEHAALSYYPDTINGIYAVFTGLLRGAKEMKLEIVDTTTGKVVWSKTEYNCYKAHYSGTQYPYVSDFDLPMADYDTGAVFGDNNAHYKVTMTASLDWDGGERNISDTYSFSFYIDYQAPTITDANFYTKYNRTTKKTEYYVDLTVYDNHYAMSLRPIVVYEKGGRRSLSDLTEYAIPVYQETRGQSTVVTVEITDYLDIIRNSSAPEGLIFYVDDYALNSSVCYVPFPETEANDLVYVSYDEMKAQGVTIDENSNVVLGVGQTLDLTQFITGKDGRKVNSEFLSMLTWESNGSAVKVTNGVIEGIVAGGENDISFTSGGLSHKEKDPNGDGYITVPEYVKISVKVSDDVINSDNSQNKVPLDEIVFTGYDTTFAFTSDIDHSAIGETGSKHYFEKGSESISFYPSEKIQLKYLVKPLNMSSDRYRVVWSSGNRRVAEVDQNGNVTAVAEGNTYISLTIYVDGVKSPIPARCEVEVKSEFIVENRVLVAYKGVGGKVVIPDDKGILYIGSFAFCHYYLDNSLEVDNKYDLDKKKTPLGNNTVTSLVIPEGVEEIRKYAFYNSDKLIDGVVSSINDSVLTSVKLPTTLKKIEEYAFYNNQNLQDVNLRDVDIVSDYAFYNCRSLNCNNLGGINLKNINVIGTNAFANCTSLTSIDLSNLRRSGASAFKGCTKLTKVVLGDYTRVAESMFEGCTALSDLSKINSDVIPDKAFLNCYSLPSVQFKNDLTYLGNRAFGNCRSLSTVVFDGNCEHIGDFAFAGTSSLSRFTLPDCDVSLGNYVFASNINNTANGDIVYGTSALGRITFLPSTNVTEMGVGVFFGIKNLSYVINSTGHYYDATSGILYEDASRTKILSVSPSANLGDFVLPDTVTEIADGAFAGNENLTSFTVSSSGNLKKIGYGAFSYCTNLTKVILPETLALEIGTRAFYACQKLSFVKFDGVAKIGSYAFWGTSLKNTVSDPLNIVYNGVEIGEYAFADIATLEGIHIGDNANILPYAFAGSGLRIVNFVGEGITIGESAFEQCTKLSSIDLDKAVGKLGDYAFYRCYLLGEVSIANITEIGEGCFQACEKLTTVNNTQKLKIVRFGAFSPYITIYNDQMDLQSEVPLVNIDLSGVELIEGFAFLSTSLVTADLSSLQDVFTVDENGEPAVIPAIGESAFGYCESLTTVVFGENAQYIADLAFYGCSSLQLSENDLQNVARIYSLAFYQVKLPQNLNLANVTDIDRQAFLGEEKVTSNLVSVSAPKLEFAGMQCFANCTSLAEFASPKLAAIGFGAFSNTAVTELEISKDFEELGYGAMMGASKFTGFYVTDGSQKKFTYDGAAFRLDGGAFYSKLPNGYYQLDSYPQAKTDTEYTVLENTVRIEYQAVYGNKNLIKVTLPVTLRSIGNCAFLDCVNLTQVVFRSFYAPTLEGTLYSDEEITRDEVDSKFDRDNFDLLYKYDYYYMVADEISIYYRNMLQYSNFVGLVASKEASNLTCIIPSNSQGYDSVLYRAYFKKSSENSGKTMGAGAIAFIDAVNALPDGTADRFDKTLVDAATTAYNALSDDDMTYIDQALIGKYLAARKSMNVDSVRYTISNLYGMDATEYSYNALRDALAKFNGLTDEEKALVSNASVLDTKLADLKKALKVDDIDFNNPFSVYAPKDTGENAQGNLALIVSLSCVGGVLVLGGVAALVTVLTLKKKKLAKTTAEDSNEK
ncbi:MAG: leucine-rich repeat protein [Corallococcus sp.]|nr:leucine-rich repeat protein [Corallococcus sp.]MCM1359578.1 leucine-rich repeat protein [Corallococcus sp.]MCM1395170.1 leucine-rich repeat protein [Corallococcus sp.]